MASRREVQRVRDTRETRHNRDQTPVIDTILRVEGFGSRLRESPQPSPHGSEPQAEGVVRVPPASFGEKTAKDEEKRRELRRAIRDSLTPPPMF